MYLRRNRPLLHSILITFFSRSLIHENLKKPFFALSYLICVFFFISFFWGSIFFVIVFFLYHAVFLFSFFNVFFLFLLFCLFFFLLSLFLYIYIIQPFFLTFSFYFIMNHCNGL